MRSEYTGRLALGAAKGRGGRGIPVSVSASRSRGPLIKAMVAAKVEHERGSASALTSFSASALASALTSFSASALASAFVHVGALLRAWFSEPHARASNAGC